MQPPDDQLIRGFVEWFKKQHPSRKFKLTLDKTKGAFIVDDTGQLWLFCDYYAEMIRAQ